MGDHVAVRVKGRKGKITVEVDFDRTKVFLVSIPVAEGGWFESDKQQTDEFSTHNQLMY